MNERRGRPKKNESTKRNHRYTVAFSKSEVEQLIEHWKSNRDRFMEPMARKAIADGLTRENVPSFVYYAAREMLLPPKSLAEMYPYHTPELQKKLDEEKTSLQHDEKEGDSNVESMKGDTKT